LNVVLIMTSNLGSQAILEAAGREDRAEVKAQIQTALRGHFRPEFLNRVDEIVIFEPLGHAQIEAIVGLQLDRLRKLLAEQRLMLDVTDAARSKLAEESYDPAFGARPVKRTIQRRVRDALAEGILAGSYPAGATVRVDVRDGALVLAPA
jgi:ATP-dependent Clp protease ATP-binding subunit ClpB